jgi:hypothetical protein
LPGCHGLEGDSRAKVFWFFFQKRTAFFPTPSVNAVNPAKLVDETAE